VHRKYIPIYIQQDAELHSLFITGNCSTCFGWIPNPSSGAHTTESTASGTCQKPVLLPAAIVEELEQNSNFSTIAVWQVPDAVDTVVCAPDDGWRYHPKHVERFSDINKLCNVASFWIYIGIWLFYVCRKISRKENARNIQMNIGPGRTASRSHEPTFV